MGFVRDLGGMKVGVKVREKVCPFGLFSTRISSFSLLLHSLQQPRGRPTLTLQQPPCLLYTTTTRNNISLL